MARTLKTNGVSFLSLCCCCFIVLLVFRTCDAQAGNSSGVVSSDGETDTGDGESSVEKGMRPFFDMVNTFLEVVQPNKITEQSWLNLSEVIKDGKIHTDQLTKWENWAEYLVGFIVCAIVGLLFFVAMPITGLVFCCCRCCGKCGGKPKPQDPKHAGCKRTTFCTLLLVVNTMALAGVVCTFLSNQILYDKLRNENDVGPTGRLIHATDLINGFANTTVDEVETAVLDRFVDASGAILRDIADTAEEAIEKVIDLLNVNDLLDQSKGLSVDVNQTQEELLNVAEQLSFLSEQGQLLRDNLTQIRNDIDALCAGLGTACNGKYDGSQYTISADFSGLDNLSSEAGSVARSMNLSQDIAEAESTVEDSKATANRSVHDSITESTGSIDDLERRIREAVGNFTEQIQDAVTGGVDEFRSDIRNAQDDITKYSKYAYYTGIGVGCALVLVVVLYYMGILFGLCGERPGFGAQCCNTGTGANFLMAGVGITFLLGWIIMLVCVVLFVTGGPIFTEICRYFVDHDPQELKPFNDAVMNNLDLQKNLFDGKDVNLDLVKILEGCRNDTAVYTVLQLDNMVNISQYTDLNEVEDALNKLKDDSFTIPNVTILTPEMSQSIRNFASAGLEGIEFDKYDAETNKSLTEGELPELADELEAIANSPGVPVNDKNALISNAAKLRALHTYVVVPMQAAEASLVDSLAFLRVQAQSQLNASTHALLDALEKAQNDFNSQKDVLVKEQVDILIGNVLGTTRGIVDDMLDDVYHNIGKCGPIYDSFYVVSDAACISALEPLNALWFSIGWCLFFFVPAIIFAVKLAGLYRREHEERDFDDPNFSLYEGGKHDDIPLTSRQQPGRPSGDYAGSRGVANNGYQGDSYMGPSDYPNYKGGEVNAGYDGYQSPPPYGAHSRDAEPAP